MNGLIMAAQLILGLSIIVILHEFGHFIAARAFGIKVEKFYLFFDAWGFKLFSIKKGDTEYGIGWLPLGGYVKISGMIDESMDKEQLKKPPQPWEFRSKPAWQRLIVMVAGVVMNLILGIIIFSFVIISFEKQYLPNDEVVEGIYAFESGRDVGLKTGDKILAINGKKIERFKDAQSISVLFGSEIDVDRNGSQVNIVIPDSYYKKLKETGSGLLLEPLNFPFHIDSVIIGMNAEKAGLLKGDKVLSLDDVVVDSWGNFREFIVNNKGKDIDIEILRNSDTISSNLTIDSTGIIGVITSSAPYMMKDYSLVSAFQYGTKDAIELLVVNLKGLGKLFSGEEKVTESLQGPIGIARIYGGQWNWRKFWFITGLLSMFIGFVNILPIPALDGGHVIFLTYEAITRRRLSDKFMEYAQIVGMVILIALMVFVVGNDIFKLLK
jgi:regulator of sigma E protease